MSKGKPIKPRPLKTLKLQWSSFHFKTFFRSMRMLPKLELFGSAKTKRITKSSVNSKNLAKRLKSKAPKQPKALFFAKQKKKQLLWWTSRYKRSSSWQVILAKGSLKKFIMGLILWKMFHQLSIIAAIFTEMLNTLKTTQWLKSSQQNHRT